MKEREREREREGTLNMSQKARNTQHHAHEHTLTRVNPLLFRYTLTNVQFVGDLLKDYSQEYFTRVVITFGLAFLFVQV